MSEDVAIKAWCPETGETEEASMALTEWVRPRRAAEDVAARVYQDPRVGNVIDVLVRDDSGALLTFHVEVDTSPRFEAYKIG